ncbi:MAG: peptidoglycan DD-metalloendopeptidase family protein [Chitinophagaceae bacterium]|nr:peptidoglycan DD-metalloendopeptidase family protein [Chitinophagaceae bacterium]
MAQSPGPNFGGLFGFNPETHDNMPPEQRQRIAKEIKQNVAMLREQGIIPSSGARGQKEVTVKFAFPLRQATGFNDPGFYSISNFVDHGAGGTVKDFNGGTRTYNEHLGTDFFTAPFWWKKKDENAVEVIAGADGVIVAKDGSQPDTSCANCTPSSPESCWWWNAIYVRQEDGTIAYYGHMKQNSLTTKGVGDAVTKGEFLGIVGSSGNSSGPHLHFEVWEDASLTKLLDPWGGPDNPDYKTPEEGLWENQLPYWNPKLLKAYTSDHAPEVWKQCYNGAPENTYDKLSFSITSDTVYMNGFVADLSANDGTTKFSFKLYRPNGTLYTSWTHPGWSYNYYYASIYYWFKASTLATPGEWTLVLTYYSGESATLKFTLYDPTPLDLVSFEAKAGSNNVLLNWRTENEENSDRFEIERSADGSTFSKIGTVAAKGNGGTGQNDYSFTDDAPLAGTQFYRLKIIDIDGKTKYSEVVKVNFDGVLPVKLFPNPANNFVDLKNTSGFNKVTVMNVSGQIMLTKPVSGNETRLDISKLTQGLYIVRLTGEGRDVRVKLIKN